MRRRLCLLILVIWLGFALRLHDLDAVPLRGDEAFSARYWVELPLYESLTEIASFDPHPPLAYLLFHLWGRWVGGIDSSFALRFLPLLGNIIGAAAMFALGRRLSGQSSVGLLAALMWALHPFEIWHSQDFRNYAVWAGLSAVALWLGLRLMDSTRRVDWWLYAVAASLSAFMFYTELMMMIALAAVMVMGGAKGAFARRFLALQCFIGAAVLVAFLVFQGPVLTGAAPYPGNLQPFAAADYLTRFVPALALGESIPSDLSFVWLPLSLAATLFTAVIAAKSQRQIGFIAAVAAAPLLLLGLASLRVSIFHPRYALATVPAFILLFALGGFHLAGRRPVWMCGLLLPWFILASLTLNAYFNHPAWRKSPAWDELGDFLNGRVHENDLVIQLSKDSAFGYYYRGRAEDTALPNSPFQPASEIEAALSIAAGEYDSVYVVSNAIPTWGNADVVENWMNANMQAVLLSSASGLGLRQYKTWEISADFGPPLTQFEAAVELMGYDFFAAPLPTGEWLLWLYWRPISQTARPLKSFVHVVGDVNPATGNRIWSQDDQFPQEGRLDSTSWPAGDVYRDVYYLPADQAAAGGYHLHIGWYDPVSGARLLTDGDEDLFELAAFAHPIIGSSTAEDAVFQGGE